MCFQKQKRKTCNFQCTGYTIQNPFRQKPARTALFGICITRFPLMCTLHFTDHKPPLALPGKYTVKLTVNGQSHSQPLVLKMDPRVKTSQADLEKMFWAESRVAKNLADLSTR